MKKLMFLTAITAFFLITGCTESSLNDPIPVNTQRTQKEADSRQTIPLKQIFDFGESIYSIDGAIDYTHRIIIVDPIPPAPQYYVSLHLSINAVLTNLNDESSLIIRGETEDLFYVSEEGVYVLEISFPSDGNITLVCTFLVTTDDISLNDMQLTQEL